MKKVQEPTARMTLTVATSRIPWQPLIGLLALIVVMSVVVLSGQELKHVPPAAPNYIVLHSFAGPPTDGAGPAASLLRDAAGNLYGTTEYGGGAVSACSGGVVEFGGCGVVFKLSPTGTETVLHTFAGFEASIEDGANPTTGLIPDAAGNLYGITWNGGNSCPSGDGCGTVFKLSPSGTETVLYSFNYFADNAAHPTSLVRDTAGNFYGTTETGGDIGTCFNGQDVEQGCGTVFKLSPAGTFSVLHIFTYGDDGAYPTDLVRDVAGNLYGTTAFGYGTGVFGGACNTGLGCGVVFELSASGTETVLYTFTGGADGAAPPVKV